MKTNFALFLSFLCCLTSISAQNTHVPNQIILKFDTAASQAERADIIEQLGTKLQDNAQNDNIIGDLVLLSIPAYPVTLEGIVYDDELELIGEVHRTQARVDGGNLNYEITLTPQAFDSFFGNFKNRTYSPISPECENNYPGGELSCGDLPSSDQNILVAVLDTGLDPYYPMINSYLVGAINVLTDDENGEISTSFPYNFSSPVALDDNGHGTGVTGIIAGLSQRSNIPSSSLGILPIKCFDEQGRGNLFNLLQALQAAGEAGADIINCSWSYTPDSREERQIIEGLINDLSNDKGIVIVTGAGNDAIDLSTVELVPAGLSQATNLVSVGATNGIECDGELASFSNFGSPVDIAAPGESLFVPGLGGLWSLNASGTSFASPIVVAAIIQASLASPISSNALGDQSSANGALNPAVALVLNNMTYLPFLEHYGIDGVVNFNQACGDHKKDDTSHDDNFNQRPSATNQLANHRFQLYPNPFNEQVILDNSQSKNKISSVNVYAYNGALIASLAASELEKFSIKLPPGVPDGLYLLKLLWEDGHSDLVQIIKSR